MEKKSIKPIYIVAIFLLPLLYFINGFTPWAIELWENHNRDYFYIFWSSVIFIHWLSFMLMASFLKINKLTYKDIGATLSKKGYFIFVSCMLVLALAIYGIVEYNIKDVEIDMDKLNSNIFGGIIATTSNERIFWILCASVSGYCGEFIYRGYIIKTLILTGVNKWLAVFLAAIPFVFSHGQGAAYSFNLFLSYLIIGIVLGTILLLGKRLWITISLHILILLLFMAGIFYFTV